MTKNQDSTASKKRKIQPSGSKYVSKDAKKLRTLQKEPLPRQLTMDKEATATADFSSAKTFGELNLSDALQKSVTGLGTLELSPLQRQAFPALLGGKDFVAVTDPGRDAMLSFLIPAVVLLEKHRFHARHGTGVLVVTPNRETAVQICGLASELLSGTTHTVGIIMEGANRGAEEQKLNRGISLLVATPTRLLEHMRDTTSFIFKNLKAFCVYGVAMFAGQGIDKQIREIITLIPKKDRISAIYGAEQTDGLGGLAELVCRSESVHRYTRTSTEPSGCREPQGYVIVEPDKRFLLLYSFLRKFQAKRVVVVLSSTPSVLFSIMALGSLGLPVHAIHGKQNVKTRTAAFSDFVKDVEGTLICTEEAVQGLEVPPADWVIQYDPPRSIRDFIHRRGAVQGRLVAFVQPCESGFLDELKSEGIEVEEFDFPKKKLINVQSQIEKSVARNFELHQFAKDGFRAFLQDYNHHYDSKIFEATKLDVRKVGKGFGFDTPPRVEVKSIVEKKVDKNLRTYGPEKPKVGKKRKAQ